MLKHWIIMTNDMFSTTYYSNWPNWSTTNGYDTYSDYSNGSYPYEDFNYATTQSNQNLTTNGT